MYLVDVCFTSIFSGLQTVNEIYLRTQNGEIPSVYEQN